MKLFNFFIISAALSVFCSCSNKQANRHFPRVRDLSKFQRTEFLPTPENNMADGKNSIYCVTLLYLWEQVRETIKTPLQIAPTLKDLTLMNDSRSYFGSLDKDEYSVKCEVDRDFNITGEAVFNKSLPFDEKLESYDNKLTFDGKKVASFGIGGNDDRAQNSVDLLYYKNDSDFILKLFLKDANHEMILYKTGKYFKTLSEALEDINRKIKVGNTERQTEELSWKYTIRDKDEVIIPKLQFNIETDYSTLEGNKFQSQSRPYEIKVIKQKTAFILDENGAEIKSEASAEVYFTSNEKIKEEPVHQPKKMIFNKPFFLICRKANSSNPYLGIRIANTELMTKE